MYRSLGSLLAVAATATAATIDIAVGQSGLSFSPDSTTANVGDILAFHFFSEHSVVSSSFSSPCIPDESSFFSGEWSGDSAGDMTFEVTVNSTDPIWYYCSVGKHCQAGMVGVVNPPSGQDVSAYASAAKSVAAASAPANPVGGVSTSLAVGATATGSISSSASSESKSASSSASKASSSASAASTSAEASKTSAASSASSASSSAASATSTANSAGRFGEGAVAGLAVVAGGFVAMMA